MSSTAESAPDRPTARSAYLVGAGILSSRIAGLVRERVFAHYLGTSGAADAFRAALRMPNVLQNLLGEGTLSASFIPVYSELLEQGRREEAGRVAGGIFALLLAVAAVLALIGLLLAPVLVSIFLPGFEGARREITVTATRIIFPMTGILVLSAWSLGVLNSHRRFFVPYFAPVLWNGAMITTLVVLGARLLQAELAIALAWGALAGGALQFLVQLPWVLRLERRLDISWRTRLEPLREVVRNAGPAIMGRGVVQLSGWVEVFLVSFLAVGAMAAVGYAQTLFILPVSLFGMSVAAAELPELSRRRLGTAEELRRRINAGLAQVAFYVIPTIAGYLVIGRVIVAAIFETGDFGADDTALVHLVLAGYTVGLFASTSSRLFSSAFFALHDTRTPAKIAFLRVALAGAAGAILMLVFQRFEIAGHPLGPVGLTLAAGGAAWIEWALLRRSLEPRLGRLGAGAGTIARMALAAAAAAIAGRSALLLLPDAHPWTAAVAALVPFALVYYALGRALGLEEAEAALGRILRRIGLGRRD